MGSMPLPPGAKLVSAPAIKLPPGATLVQTAPKDEIDIVAENLNRPLSFTDQLKLAGNLFASPITGLLNAPAEVWNWIKRGGHNPPSGGFMGEEPSQQMVGNAAAALAPTAVEGVKAAAPYIIPATKGAIVGGAKAAVEPVTYGHLRLPVPAPIAGAAAGGYAAGQIGLPRSVGAAIGAAAPVVRGAIKGAKTAIADRGAAVTEADASAPTTAVTSMETLDGIAQSLAGKKFSRLTPEEQAGIRQIAAKLDQPTSSTEAPKPAQVVRIDTGKPVTPAKTLEQEVAEEAARRAPEPLPEPPAIRTGKPVGVLEPGGVNTPLRPPVNKPSPETIAQKLADEMKASGTAAPEQVQPQTIAEAKEGFEPKQQANGTVNHPKHAANRIDMAQRFARALRDAGISPERVAKLSRGYVSDKQLAAGMETRWGNIAELLGEKEPSMDTIAEIIQQMRMPKASQK